MDVKHTKLENFTRKCYAHEMDSNYACVEDIHYQIEKIEENFTIRLKMFENDIATAQHTPPPHTIRQHTMFVNLCIAYHSVFGNACILPVITLIPFKTS